jgi:peptide-methionine (S)-S-oxide reductase
MSSPIEESPAIPSSALELEARSEPNRPGTDPGGAGQGAALRPSDGLELGAFAGGCFWGLEDVFRDVEGIAATAVGYAGGHAPDPTYDNVSSQTSGHAETVLVEFDPRRITYEELLALFLHSHDPTMLNRQGLDFGEQYRSAIFTFSAAQGDAARAAIARESARRGTPLTTSVTAMTAFYKAEDEHQQHDEKSGTRTCAIPRRLRRGA